MEEGHFQNHFKVYPNPSQGHVTVAFNSETEHYYTIHLVDITGRGITTYSGTASEGKNETELDLGTIEAGMYQVIFILDGKREVKKLIIQ